jgi:hypothetical protein
MSLQRKGEAMNEHDIDKHSVNCYFCNSLVDERECIPADRYNNDDGGDICPTCQTKYKFKILHYTLCDGWIDFGLDEKNEPCFYDTYEEAQAEIDEVIEDMDGYDDEQFEIKAVNLTPEDETCE